MTLRDLFEHNVSENQYKFIIIKLTSKVPDPLKRTVVFAAGAIIPLNTEPGAAGSSHLSNISDCA